jgi:hypothetical protein
MLAQRSSPRRITAEVVGAIAAGAPPLVRPSSRDRPNAYTGVAADR